ncbi:uncharacterized protein [Haliotis asinina]|uniref:uncharacterized protein isoform X2 n=1 Tax=Haliotis asinina TaxID=109174 RepID=UPI00353197DD
MLLSSRVVLCALMTQWGGCYIQLDIHPKTVHLDSSRRVTIRCSLNLTGSSTEKVYSIMLKRGQDTIAVLFQDIIRNMTNRLYNVTGSLTTKSSSVAFFQILLDNVKCLDKGNYSCIMAVKRLDKATSMGPVTSPLEIQGISSDISVSLTPDTSAYTEGEVVNVTCYRLWTSKTATWSWTLDGHEYTELNNCTYRESQCIYMCISSKQYTVTMEDSGPQVRCRSGGLVKIIRLNLSTTSIATSPEAGLSVTTTTTAPPTHITASSGDTTPTDPKCKCHHRTLKNSMATSDTLPSERHRRRRRVIIVQSRNVSGHHPGRDRASDETGYRDGCLHPQDGCLHPQDGYLHPQDGCLHPQDGCLHPQDTADSSVSESNEHVYEEID